MTIANIRLPSRDAPPEKRYSMPNPEHRPEAWGNVHAWVYGEGPLPCREDLQQVLSMANGYRHLTMYELGQEHCVRQLRDVWRARRAKGEEGE